MSHPYKFNVRRAGAKGDGKIDDTTLFQNLIDLAAERQTTIEVPPGTYGLYSLLKHGEWGWNREEIPVEEYKQLAARFRREGFRRRPGTDIP